MRVEARYGTPNHLDIHEYALPSQAKNFLADKMLDREAWAKRYNGEAARRIMAAREELDALNVGALKLSDCRRWTVRDDHTGVEFVFEIEKMEV